MNALRRSGPVFVVPVKSLAAAKSRLASCLSPQQRVSLVRAMLQDLLFVLHQAEPHARRLVVTADADVAALAMGCGAEVVREPAHCGINAAVDAACAALRPGTLCVVLHGDLPLAARHEVRALVRLARMNPVVIVPDRHRRGTNALAFVVPRAFPLHYGEESLAAHLAAASARGLRPRIVELPSLMHDIDLPDDLRTASGLPAGCTWPRESRHFLHLGSCPQDASIS